MGPWLFCQHSCRPQIHHLQISLIQGLQWEHFVKRGADGMGKIECKFSGTLREGQADKQRKT